MTLGKKLTVYRKASGYTQQQLGEVLSVSAQAISKWENDQAEPDLQTLRKISTLYRVKVDDLLFGETFVPVGEAPASAEAAASAAASAEAAAATAAPAPSAPAASEAAQGSVSEGEAAAPRKLIGRCVMCSCAVYEGNEVRLSSGLLCKTCYGKRVKAAKAKKVADPRNSHDSMGMRAPSVYSQASEDGSSFGWGFLSFLIPIVGLILYLVWREELPLRAWSCLWGFLADIILGAVLSILLVVLASCAVSCAG